MDSTSRVAASPQFCQPKSALAKAPIELVHVGARETRPVIVDCAAGATRTRQRKSGRHLDEQPGPGVQCSVKPSSTAIAA